MGACRCRCIGCYLWRSRHYLQSLNDEVPTDRTFRRLVPPMPIHKGDGLVHRLPRLHFLSITLAALCSAAVAHGEALTLPRTDAVVTIDGVLDDDAWQDALQIAVDLETEPGENIAAPVETVAYVIENGDTLFVAFDARDPDPGAINTRLPAGSRCRMAGRFRRHRARYLQRRASRVRIFRQSPRRADGSHE